MTNFNMETLMWAVGAIIGVQSVAMGWLFKMINTERKERQEDAKEYESRLRKGISYPEAERMVDAKIQPLKESLDRNTQAVVHLTNVLLERGLKAKD